MTYRLTKINVRTYKTANVAKRMALAAAVDAMELLQAAIKAEDDSADWGSAGDAARLQHAIVDAYNAFTGADY